MQDLNRVKEKPVTEAVEGNGDRPDEDVARETLAQHKRRNDSVRVVVFGSLMLQERKQLTHNAHPLSPSVFSR